MRRPDLFAFATCLLCVVPGLSAARSAQTPPLLSQAQPPPPQTPPPCPTALRGAARGAAGGAVFGAIGGNAGKGAAIGAAVGGVGRAVRNGSARASGQCY
jgi:hypothetical protein